MNILNETPFACKTQRDYIDETLARVDAFTKVTFTIDNGRCELDPWQQ